MTDNLFVINEGFSTLEKRAAKSGKTRFAIRVSAQPVAINLDKAALGGTVAAAIAQHFRQKIKGISAVAAPATLAARKTAAKAFAAGAAWAAKRYSGGRTGALAPNQTNRAFNDSGRFADTIAVGADSKGNWRINVAANRLSGDENAVERIYRKLVEYVPEIGDPTLLMANDFIRRHLKKTADDMIKIGRASEREAVVGVIKALFRTAEILAG